MADQPKKLMDVAREVVAQGDPLRPDIQRMARVLVKVEELHKKHVDWPKCIQCDLPWPCRTAHILHEGDDDD